MRQRYYAGALLFLFGCPRSPVVEVQPPVLVAMVNPCLENSPESKTKLLSNYSSSDLVLDESYFYWVEQDSDSRGMHRILRVPKAGGTPIVLSEFDYTHAVSSITIDERCLYSTTSHIIEASSKIWAQSKAGGPIFLLANLPDTRIGPLLVDESNLYWSSRPGYFQEKLPVTLMKMAKTGGEPTTLATLDGDSDLSLIADDDNLYWRDTTAGKIETWTIKKIAKKGGTPVTLASAQTFSMAIDEESVYWADVRDGGSVMRVSKDGGPTTMLAKDQGGAPYLVVDSANLYWWSSTILNTSEGWPRLYQLVKASKNGENPSIIASKTQPKDSFSLFSDNDGFYWVSIGNPKNQSKMTKFSKMGGETTTIKIGSK
jgi:hypothetical protein